MKKLTVLVAIILIVGLLSGCGIFNLDGWVWPDDLEFLACIKELDTPRKIGDYMYENFTCESHPLWTLSPYKLWKIKKGDCDDMSNFGDFAAHRHGYETYQIKIIFDRTFLRHCIAVYVEDDGLSFTDCKWYSDNYGCFFDTFREVVDFDCVYHPDYKLKKYIVYDYWNNEVEVGYNY